MKNYYDLFGIAPNADRETIKRAYRNLARQYHPDARPNDPTAAEQFKQINEAYQTLINVERRAHYDTQLRHRQAPSTPSAHVTPHDPSIANTKVMYPSRLKNDNTNAWVRYMFIGLLITLMIIILQGILVSLVENDASTQRRAPNLATQRANAQSVSSPTPAGPATTRQTIVPFDERVLQNIEASCQINLQGGPSTCDSLSVIQWIEPLENERGVLQIDIAGYQRVVLRLEYRGPANNWTLNLGGSIKNDGTTDISSNPNDAQLSLFGRDLLIYSNSQNDHTQLARITNVILEADGIMTLDIQHQQVAWHTPSTSEELASRHWLNLQANDATVYIGLNRAILQPTTRTGSGLAILTIWLLP